MSDVFISHVEEDGEVGVMIAEGLAAAGYTTWYYERDSYPGPDYLEQIDRAISESHAVIVVISPTALASQQVEDEVKWAREQGKRFIPVLKGISWAEFQNRRPRWRMALGIATAVSVPSEGVGAILSRVIRGLEELGIRPPVVSANVELLERPASQPRTPAQAEPILHMEGALSGLKLTGFDQAGTSARQKRDVIRLVIRITGAVLHDQGKLLRDVREAVSQRLVAAGYSVVRDDDQEYDLSVEIRYSSPGTPWQQYEYELLLKTKNGTLLGDDKGISFFRGSFMDFPIVGPFVRSVATNDPTSLISLLRSQDVSARTSAALKLSAIAQQPVVKALTDAMGSDELTAMNSVSSLLAIAGRSQDRKLLEPLLKECGDKDWVEQVSAELKILGGLDYHDPISRRGAAWLLGEIGVKVAEEPLIRVAKKDADTSVRQAANDALAKIKADPIGGTFLSHRQQTVEPADEITVECHKSEFAGHDSVRVIMRLSKEGVWWRYLERLEKETILPWRDIESYSCYATTSEGHALDIQDAVDGGRGGTFRFRRIDLRAVDIFLKKYVPDKAKRACRWD